MSETDILIIGGGIAGVSVAARLAGRAKVILLEREDLLAAHTTGRSAALFSETYGNDAVREWTRESRPFFEHPPEGFAPVPLVAARPSVFVARAEAAGKLEAMLAENGALMRRLAPDDVYTRVPVLRRDVFAAFAEETEAAGIDVAALFDGFRRMALHGGVDIRTNQEVLAVDAKGSHWSVATRDGRFSARVVVNAAGAWAGVIGRMAGLGDRGLTPMRRTAITIEPPDGVDVSAWPFVCDIEDTFYFKPEAGLILASPVDETPSEPCDAQPDEIDVATIAWRIEEATTLRVSRIPRRWAGLRTFTPDRTPLFAFDDGAQGFFWLAGQGGYGIQTSPFISVRAADLILESL